MRSLTGQGETLALFGAGRGGARALAPPQKRPEFPVCQFRPRQNDRWFYRL